MGTISAHAGGQENNGGRVVRNVTISAPFLSLFIGIATTVVFVIFVYAWKRLWNTPLTGVIFKQIFLYLLVAIPAHELLHALGFRIFSNMPWANIKFGFSLKDFVFYTHPDMPVNKAVYAWAVALPALIIGVMPLVLGLIICSLPLSSLGLISIFNAAGDLLVLWKLREVGKEEQILDHPDKIGFQIVER
ncbi:MAG: DUF3267 domain-containing protein [bacterium]|nr:DUF3267 domain-containing protein [bacterium]